MSLELLPQALCSYDDIRTAIRSDLSDNVRDFVTLLINGLTVLAEGPDLCSREFLYDGRTEIFDGEHSDGEARAYIQVAAPPIEFDSLHVYEDKDREFTDDTELDKYEDYRVDLKQGIIRMRSSCFNPDIQTIKVTYNGGLVNQARDPQVFAPADLRMACALQVASWYRNKDQLGLTSLSIPGGGSAGVMNTAKLLSNVRDIFLKPGNRIFR